MAQHLDGLIIGDHYFSYLLGFFIRPWCSRLVIVRDSSVSYGDQWVCELTLLEKNFLEEVGNEWDIAPFKNIDNYLHPKSQTFIFSQTHLKLYGTSLERLRELFRKFPSFISHSEALKWLAEGDEFDRLIQKSCYELAIKGLYLSTYHKFDHKILRESLPEVVSRLFEPLYLAWRNNVMQDDVVLAEFLYMIQWNVRGQVATSLSEEEFYFLCFGLLLPLYRIEHETLLSDLEKQWSLQGGKVSFEKFSYLDEFHSSMTVGGEQIMAKQSYYLGNSIPSQLKIADSNFTKVSGINLKYHFETLSLEKEKGSCFRGLFRNHLGADISLWEFSVVDSSHIDSTIYYLEQTGSKGEFWSKEMISLLNQEILRLFPELSQELQCVKIKQEHSHAAYAYHLGWCRKASGSQSFYKSQQDGTFRLLGPLQAQSLGRFSFLEELKSQVSDVVS